MSAVRADEQTARLPESSCQQPRRGSRRGPHCPLAPDQRSSVWRPLCGPCPTGSPPLSSLLPPVPPTWGPGLGTRMPQEKTPLVFDRRRRSCSRKEEELLQQMVLEQRDIQAETGTSQTSPFTQEFPPSLWIMNVSIKIKPPDFKKSYNKRKRSGSGSRRRVLRHHERRKCKLHPVYIRNFSRERPCEDGKIKQGKCLHTTDPTKGL